MIESIIADFNIRQPFTIQSLGNAGGFGGSKIWKVHQQGLAFCLKRWPEDFQNEKRIEWIHRILKFAAANGCPELAAPIHSNLGTTFLFRNQTYWELTPWAAGIPASQIELEESHSKSVLEFLARFHQAAARYHLNFAPSNNLTMIRNRLLQLGEEIRIIDPVLQRQSLISRDDWAVFKRIAPKLGNDIARFVIPYCETRLPVQPVIRDIHQDHIYFENGKVSSVIDFGAMQIDSVACDLSRLLGSFHEEDVLRISRWLDYYSSIRQLSPIEREMVMPMIHGGVILGIANWLNWLTVDQKTFDSMDAVTHRFQNLMQRFKRFC